MKRPTGAGTLPLAGQALLSTHPQLLLKWHVCLALKPVPFETPCPPLLFGFIGRMETW